MRQEDVHSDYLFGSCCRFRIRLTNHTANHVAGFGEASVTAPAGTVFRLSRTTRAIQNTEACCPGSWIAPTGERLYAGGSSYEQRKQCLLFLFYCDAATKAR